MRRAARHGESPLATIKGVKRLALPWGLALGGLGLAAFLGWWLWQGTRTETIVLSPPIQTSQPVGEIYGTQRAGQTFVASYPNLYGVDVLLATYRRANNCTLIFHLIDLQDGREVFTTRLGCADVQDNAFRSFTFPTIKNAQGRAFYFYMESPDATPGNAITAWASADDAYPQGKLYRGEQAGSGDLGFRTRHYRPSLGEVIESYLERMTESKPGLAGRKELYLSLLLLYLVLFGALVMLAIRREQRP